LLKRTKGATTKIWLNRYCNQCVANTYKANSELGIFVRSFGYSDFRDFQLRKKFGVELCTVIGILPGSVAQVIKTLYRLS
jgi:hypothetical protein